jgi:hypothetical protein
MNAQDRELLTAIEPNEQVSRRDRAALAPLGTTLDIAAGRVIEREGGSSTQLVVLVRGIAAVTADGALEELLGRGDAFGDAGVSGRLVSRALVAAAPLRIHVFNLREFGALRSVLPQLGERLLRSGTATAGLVRTWPQHRTSGYEHLALLESAGRH